jgi:hypothetical protein
MAASLRFAADLGPNAALLVAGASLKRGVSCRMWLNDIRDGHYGDAIPLLEETDALANAIYGVEQGATRTFSLCVSEANYPDSIIELAKVLDDWHPRGGARLGFLDPMRYRIQGRRRAETSSEDHRQWLRRIAFEGFTCAVQFTGHCDHPSLERELCSLHDDAVAEGYTASRAFKRAEGPQAFEDHSNPSTPTFRMFRRDATLNPADLRLFPKETYEDTECLVLHFCVRARLACDSL